MPSVDFQKALFSALDAALSCPVHDEGNIPKDVAFPYVSIGDTITTDDSNIVEPIENEVVLLSIWSKYRGKKEVLELGDAIRSALHRQPLALDSGRAIRVFVTRVLTNLEPDGLTYQGAVTVDALIAR